jgi:tetratricopeptide (TPR) repeat protein
MRAGATPEATFEEARAAARDPSSDMAQWPSIRRGAEGYAKVTGSLDSVRLLCNIARAQARAGLKASAAANLDEALQTVVGALSISPSATAAPTAGYAALADIADAQREAGLANAAHETLYRAAVAADAMTPDRVRAAALARVAEVRLKATDGAPDSFARALAVGRALPDDRDRAFALQGIAKAQANAGLRDAAARTFAEAAGLAYQDGRALRDIADAQRQAGLIPEAAATFEAAFAVTMADEHRMPLDVFELVRRIAYSEQGSELLAVSPGLGVRLLEAALTATEPIARAELLSTIARALPK